MGLYVGNTRYKVMVGNNRASFMAESSVPVPNNYLTFTAAEDSTQLYLTFAASTITVSIEYNVNDTQWLTYTSSSVISLNEGDFVRFRGTNDRLSTSNNNQSRFYRTSGSMYCTGDVTTLLDPDGNVDVLPTFCFAGLLRLRYLLSAPYFPSTQIQSNSYNNIFNGAIECKSYHFATISSATNMFANNLAAEYIIIDAATPPEIGSTTITGLKSDCIIYVPDNSVNAYKAAQYWDARASYIKGISEKP